MLLCRFSWIYEGSEPTLLIMRPRAFILGVLTIMPSSRKREAVLVRPGRCSKRSSCR